MVKDSPRIIGLFTSLLSEGGIQRVSRHISVCLQGYCRERGGSYLPLSLNDPLGRHRFPLGGETFEVYGCGGDKISFLKRAVMGLFSRPGLVVTIHPHLAPVGAMIQGVIPSALHILFTHGVEVWQPLRGLKGWAFRKAEVICAPSQYTRRKVIELQQVPEKRVRCLPWGLDPNFAQVAFSNKALPLPDSFPSDGEVILSVGRLSAMEQYKGMDTLIEALPLILEDFPNAYLVIVGDGDDRPRLEALAVEKGVAKQVCFLGWLEEADLCACYAHSTLFAMPSRGEGFGLVFLEAMAFGKPVIAADRGGPLDFLQEGQNGFLVPYGDVNRLKEVVTYLLQDKEAGEQIGSRARQMVLSRYLFEHFQQRFWGLLDEIAGN